MEELILSILIYVRKNQYNLAFLIYQEGINLYFKLSDYPESQRYSIRHKITRNLILHRNKYLPTLNFLSLSFFRDLIAIRHKQGVSYQRGVAIFIGEKIKNARYFLFLTYPMQPDLEDRLYLNVYRRVRR